MVSLVSPPQQCPFLGRVGREQWPACQCPSAGMPRRRQDGLKQETRARLSVLGQSDDANGRSVTQDRAGLLEGSPTQSSVGAPCSAVSSHWMKKSRACCHLGTLFFWAAGPTFVFLKVTVGQGLARCFTLFLQLRCPGASVRRIMAH